jgi:histone deacetylase 1/2
VYVSKDVLFNEQRFPYNQIFSKNKSDPILPTSNTSSSQTSLFLPSLSTHTPTPTRQLSSPPSTPTSSNPTQSPPLNPTPLTTIPVSPEISTPSSSSNYSTTSSPPIQTSNASQHIFSSPDSGASSSNSTPVVSTTPPRVSHHMLTRSKTKNQPTILVTHIEPTSVKQALLSSHWHAAMKEEYDALIRNNTWTLVPPPVHKQPIGCKWVFRVKENPDGTIHKYKARFVATGFHQQAGSDFTETFSPVVKPVTVKTVLTMVSLINGPSSR